MRMEKSFWNQLSEEKKMQKTKTINSEKILVCEELTKTFEVGESIVVAANEIFLEIEKEEFAVIMGRSGSGKSTLLGLLAGLINPSYGKILVDGLELRASSRSKLADMRRYSIGIIFQNSHLHPHLKAIENIELPMMIAGNKTRIERMERAEELLDLVGMYHRAEHFPYELSGGEKQRIAIARALANNPKVLLADEPTGDLDSNTSREIIEVLKKLNQEKGVTIVLVTHDSRILKHATRSIKMSDGEIVSDERVKAE